jgi:hypothetical protein
MDESDREGKGSSQDAAFGNDVNFDGDLVVGDKHVSISASGDLVGRDKLVTNIFNDPRTHFLIEAVVIGILVIATVLVFLLTGGFALVGVTAIAVVAAVVYAFGIAIYYLVTVIQQTVKASAYAITGVVFAALLAVLGVTCGVAALPILSGATPPIIGTALADFAPTNPAVTPRPTGTWIASYPPYATVDTANLTLVPDQPYVVVENALNLPISVFVDNEDRGMVGPMSNRVLLVNNIPAEVTWELQPMRRSDGETLGDQVRGIFHQVYGGDKLQIGRTVGDVQFFYPRMTNRSDSNCAISVNDGLSDEQRPGSLPAHTENVVAGYFVLHADSNVTLYCGGKVWWWGIRVGQSQAPKPLSDIVDPRTGVVDLTLTP